MGPGQVRVNKKKGNSMKRFAFGASVLTLVSTIAFAADEEKPEPGFNEPTFKGLEFRSIGPAFMSGRIADIAIDPSDRSTWYVGVRTNLVYLHACLEQWLAGGRITTVHRELVVRGKRVGDDRDLDAATLDLRKSFDASFQRHEIR